MKKFFLFAYLLSVIAFYGYSQSLTLSNNAGPIVANSIIDQRGTPDSTELVTYLLVTNTGSRTINVLCKRTEISLMEGTQFTMCWANGCYPSSVKISPNAESIDPGQTATDFSGHYVPTETEYFTAGESLVRWTFFADNDANDSVSVVVKYITYPMGLDESQADRITLSSAVPNPASVKATFTYSIPSGADGFLVVRNMVGTAVSTEQLINNAGKITINTSGLPAGLYFATLTVNGKLMQTRKMIVQR